MVCELFLNNQHLQPSSLLEAIQARFHPWVQWHHPSQLYHDYLSKLAFLNVFSQHIRKNVLKPLFTLTAIEPVDLNNFNQTEYTNEIYVQFPSCNIKINHRNFHPLEMHHPSWLDHLYKVVQTLHHKNELP